MSNLLKPALLIVFCFTTISSFTQATKDTDAILKWLKDLKGPIPPYDPCDFILGTGPYDPTPCLDKDINYLTGLRAKATNNAEVTGIINNQIKKATNAKRNWQSLSSSQKAKRIRFFRKLSTVAQQNKYDLKSSLAAISRDNKSTLDEKNLAARLERRYPGKACYAPPCLCVVPEGCKCCLSDFLTDLMGSKTSW